MTLNEVLADIEEALALNTGATHAELIAYYDAIKAELETKAKSCEGCQDFVGGCLWDNREPKRCENYKEAKP